MIVTLPDYVEIFPKRSLIEQCGDTDIQAASRVRLENSKHLSKYSAQWLRHIKTNRVICKSYRGAGIKSDDYFLASLIFRRINTVTGAI